MPHRGHERTSGQAAGAGAGRRVARAAARALLAWGLAAGTALAQPLPAIPGALNAADFGFSEAASAEQNGAALACALAYLPATSYPTPGPILVIPPGTYTATRMSLPYRSATILGYGARIAFTDYYAAIDLGMDAYLTDLTAGYHTVKISGLHIAPARGAVGIRNKGVRRVQLQDVVIVGGAGAVDSEGCWAGCEIRSSHFHGATGIGVHLRQRNNNFMIEHGATLGCGGTGVVIDTTSFGGSPNAENKGISVRRHDMEGNGGGGLRIAGNVGSTEIVPWCENNAAFCVQVDNAPATAGKQGVSIHDGLVYGSPIVIGTDPHGSNIYAVTVFGNEFADSNLTWADTRVFQSSQFNNRASGSTPPEVADSRFFASSAHTSTLPSQTLQSTGWTERTHVGLPYAGDTWVVGANAIPTSDVSANLDQGANGGMLLRLKPTEFQVLWAGAGGNPRKLATALKLDWQLISTPLDVEVTDPTRGVILRSPDGARHRLRVSSNGALYTETVCQGCR
jgi:hypothetical protein